MADKPNRRDLIVDTAAELFMDHGYDATSVRQIAEEVGCTEAALYYHFKDGKRELLQTVLECNMPDLIGILDQCNDAASLYDLIKQFGYLMARLGSSRLKRLRWLHTEFPRLSDDERLLFHQTYLLFHKALMERVRRHVTDPKEANVLTWLLLLTMFGYGQLFLNLNVQAVADVNSDELVEALARALSAGR